MIDLGKETSIGQAPGCLAFFSAVFAAYLLLVSFELFVEQPVSNQLMLSLGLTVADKQDIVVIDTDPVVLNLQHHLFADPRE